MTIHQQCRRTDACSIHIVLISALIICSYTAVHLNLAPADLILPLSFVQIAMFVWMAWSWKWVTGTLFDPYTLFTSAAAAFHTGQMVLECLHLNDGKFLYGLLPPEIALQAVFLVVLSFAFLHLGALVGLARRRQIEFAVEADAAIATRNDLRLIGWGLFVISIVPAILILKDAVRAAMLGGYFYAMFAGQSATGFGASGRVLAALLVPSLFFIVGSGRNRSFPRLISAFVMAVYCGAYLFIGSRTVAAVSLATYAWLWDRLVHPLPRTAIVASGVLAVFVVFPLVALTREASGETRSSEYLVGAWSSMEKPPLNSLSEAGGTLITVGYTLELVPNLRNFDMGMSYGMALLTVFPNLFWDKHPAVAYGTPGNWMLEMIDPQMAASGGGLGFSFIAEAYYNFGWGGPLLIAMLGFILGRLVSWVSDSRDPLRYVTVANVLLPLLWSVRNEASGTLRGIVWVGIVPFVLAKLMSEARCALSKRPRAQQCVSR